MKMLMFWLSLSLARSQDAGDPLKAALSALQEVTKPTPAVRGEPFPSIPGPSPSDRVQNTIHSSRYFHPNTYSYQIRRIILLLTITITMRGLCYAEIYIPPKMFLKTTR